MYKLVLLSVLLCFSMVVNSEMNSELSDSGVKLKPCPDSPNCVSSLANQELHRIAPYSYEHDYETTKRRLIAAINNLPRISVVKDEGKYLHVTQTSFLFRFVDDIEFIFDEENRLIHFRSASRVGRSDFGVNRKRMEKIRALFEQ